MKDAPANTRVLVINPGSTSTKVSLFVDDEELVAEVILHAVEELAGYAKIFDQTPMREAAITTFLSQNGVQVDELDAIVARGGLLHPLRGGVYRVNEAMLSDLSAARYGEHASNLGAIIASRIATAAAFPALVADPVVVDELDEVARLSGFPELPRRSIFHALNQKSAAREAAARIGRSYEELNIIVAHLGGGISVGAHFRGRVVDVNNALDGDGPFSPERSGGIPAGQLVDFVFESGLSRKEIRQKITGGGGMVAYCGTNSLVEVEQRMQDGDARAKLVFEAMAYQICQEIAKHGATFSGSVDLIVITGGMAQNGLLIKHIRSRVGYLAPIEVIPGEREMISLAAAARSVLCGKAVALDYESEP